MEQAYMKTHRETASDQSAKKTARQEGHSPIVAIDRFILHNKRNFVSLNHTVWIIVLNGAQTFINRVEMNKRILVAENDPDILYILTVILTEAGYKVESLSEGSSIVERKIDLPDLFILDKDMPLIDGLALCKYLKVKDETKHIPVIMISAYHKLREKAKETGVDEFLEKPFDIKHLLKTVDEWMGRQMVDSAAGA